jgi:hypothetical protein
VRRTSEPVPRIQSFFEHLPTIEEVLIATRARLRELWKEKRRHKQELKRQCLARKGGV